MRTSRPLRGLCTRHASSALPCSSTSLGGSISTLFIYGFCLLQGANLLSDGSEMLLEVLDPGLIGGAPFFRTARIPSTLERSRDEGGTPGMAGGIQSTFPSASFPSPSCACQHHRHLHYACPCFAPRACSRRAFFAFSRRLLRAHARGVCRCPQGYCCPSWGRCQMH